MAKRSITEGPDDGDRRRIPVTAESETAPFWETYDAETDRWIRD